MVAISLMWAWSHSLGSTGHADVIMVREMLMDAGFKVPDIDMGAYMKVRALTQSL